MDNCASHTMLPPSPPLCLWLQLVRSASKLVRSAAIHPLPPHLEPTAFKRQQQLQQQQGSKLDAGISPADSAEYTSTEARGSSSRSSSGRAGLLPAKPGLGSVQEVRCACAQRVCAYVCGIAWPL